MYQLQNDYIRLILDEFGALKSMVCLPTGRELILQDIPVCLFEIWTDQKAQYPQRLTDPEVIFRKKFTEEKTKETYYRSSFVDTVDI